MNLILYRQGKIAKEGVSGNDNVRKNGHSLEACKRACKPYFFINYLRHPRSLFSECHAPVIAV